MLYMTKVLSLQNIYPNSLIVTRLLFFHELHCWILVRELGIFTSIFVNFFGRIIHSFGSPFWEANGRSAIHCIAHLLYYSKIHYIGRISPPHVSILSQILPFCVLKPHVSTSILILSSHSHLCLPRDSSHWSLPTEMFYAFPIFSICAMSSIHLMSLILFFLFFFFFSWRIRPFGQCLFENK
jgi:hypothetical protein